MPDDLADSYRMTAKLPNPFEILRNKYIKDKCVFVCWLVWFFFCNERG